MPEHLRIWATGHFVHNFDANAKLPGKFLHGQIENVFVVMIASKQSSNSTCCHMILWVGGFQSAKGNH